MRFVFIDGSHVPKDRVYYPPGRLDGVLAYKESLVAPHSITEESLVGSYLVRRLMGRDEFHFFAPHLFSRNLGTSTK